MVGFCLGSPLPFGGLGTNQDGLVEHTIEALYVLETGVAQQLAKSHGRDGVIP